MSRLLKEAVLQTAFAKIGMLGFEGSGKTFTATNIAIGLAKKTGSKKVAFFDTETGSDFTIPRFKKEGIQLFVHKGRAFVDLCAFLKECQDEKVEIVIIDSITHVWKELCESYKKRKKKERLSMMDWGVLKGQWMDLTDLYLNTKVHIVLCGRAGYEYDTQENEDDKKEIVKVGTKMKVEGEFGYEPSLLLEMVRVRKSDTAHSSKKKNVKGYINRCVVLKDRSDTIQGKEFDSPKFENFLPFFNALNLGGQHFGVDTDRDSSDIFESPDRSWEEKKKKREILIETLQDELVRLGLHGRSDKTQHERIQFLEDSFGTSSKTAIENLPLHELSDGIKRIVEYRLSKEKPNPAAAIELVI